MVQDTAIFTMADQQSLLHVESGRTGCCQSADRVSVRQQFITVLPVSVSEETLD